MNDKNRPVKLGFTLVEVLVVTIVISILATITTVSWSGVQKKARDSQRSSKITVISEALEKYYQSNGSYPSCDNLSKDSNFVTTNILKGVNVDSLATPGAIKGSNSITCSTTGINSYYYDSDTTKYALTYIKEVSNKPESINSRYHQALLSDTTVTADIIGTSQINISWTAVEGAASYKVQRSTSNSFKDDLVESSQTGLSLANTGLATGTTYYFRVLSRALNASSNWSNPTTSATTTVLPPSSGAPIVVANTPSGKTTYSWPAATCATGTSAKYKYRYTINNGYDSGFVDTKKLSVDFTTSNEGYTFTVTVQAQCYTSMAESAPSNSGSASYYRPITNPTMPVTSISYSSPNVTATISTITCGADTTPQYAIRGRTNNGAWGAYTAWSNTKPTASQAATRGVKYGYQAQSRCYTAIGTTSSVITGLEATYIHPITAPTAPTVTASTPSSTTTWSWSTAVCSVGTANYQYRYTINSGYDSGWVATSNNSVSFTTSNQGYTFTVQVQSRCTNAQTSSSWSGAGSASYRRPYTYTVALAASTGGSVSGSGSFLENTTTTITATPTTGYSFSSWSGTGCSGAASHSITVTSNMSCKANFTVNTYNLSVSQGSGGAAYGGGSYTQNTYATISAYPNAGYSFSYWSGSTGCSGSASHTIYMNSTKSCTAVFAANITYYSLSVYGGAGGTTSGSAGSVAAGSSRQISASPSTGYSFNSWSSNCSGSATHNVIVNSNISCTATFTKNPPPSKTVTKTVGPQTSSSFPTTTSYNDGTYSGTLYYQSKTSSTTNGTQLSKYVRYVDLMQGSMYPANSTYNYSDAYGYSGTISYAGWDTVISAYHRQRAYYKCGDEGKGEQCWFKGTSATLPVRYGSTSTDTWAPWRYANSGILCNNATWGGDPAPNYVKICQVLYEEGSYKVPPGDPIYNAAYAGYVYKAGTPTTTYTATYSGTVYGN